jgi:hypothetical protein
MKRRSWLFALAAAALLGCSRESAPAATDSVPGDAEAPSARDALDRTSKAERAQDIESYLDDVRRSYGDESRKYLGEDDRAKFDIPVPDVEPMERKAPDLLPDAPAAEKNERP